MNNTENDIDGVSEILITEWHDDFEPNTQSKQNRGSAWILSVTILTTRDIKNSQHYTFPIAIGEKNSSHEDVLSIFYDDIQKSVDKPISVYDHTTNKDRRIRLVKLFSAAFTTFLMILSFKPKEERYSFPVFFVPELTFDIVEC